jgi:hypothetical protein
MQSPTKRIAALSAEANEENRKATEESPIELLTKEIAAIKAEMKCFNCQKKGHFASACLDPKKPKPGQGLGNRGGRGNRGNRGQGQRGGGQRGGGGGGYQPAPNYVRPTRPVSASPSMVQQQPRRRRPRRTRWHLCNRSRGLRP